MHSYGLQPTSSSHLLLLDRAACHASFQSIFEMQGLSKKDFTLVATQMISTHVCTVRVLWITCLFSSFSVLVSSSPNNNSTTLALCPNSKFIYPLPGISIAVSVKAFSVVKRKSIFIWHLRLEPTLGWNVMILLLSAQVQNWADKQKFRGMAEKAY